MSQFNFIIDTSGIIGAIIIIYSFIAYDTGKEKHRKVYTYICIVGIILELAFLVGTAIYGKEIH